MKNIFLALLLALTSVQAIAQKKASETGYGTQNFIINGDISFNQRGVCGTGSCTAGIADSAFVVDRFQYYKVSTATHSTSQSSDAPTLAQSGHASRYSAALTLTAADTSIAVNDYLLVMHKIEGANWAQIAGKSFTLSFWVKATAVGDYGVAFRNGALSSTYVAKYTINSTETWEKKTITVQTPSTGVWSYDHTTGIQVVWAIMAGTNAQTSNLNAWQAGTYIAPTTQVNGVNTGATNFKLAQVMLNTGDRAAPFALAGGTIGGELTLAQRYYERQDAWSIQYWKRVVIATEVDGSSFKVTKRALPTVTIFDASSNLNRVVCSSNTATAQYIGLNGFGYVGVSGGGLTPNATCGYGWFADAEL